MTTLTEARQELKELIDDITGVKGARTFDSFKLVRDNGCVTDDGTIIPPCIYFGDHDDALSLDYSLWQGKIFLTFGEGTHVHDDAYVYNAETFYKAWEAV